jgi:hypothetical protein
MLPGFRFLFAAILLSMSILIFGLGAAALLRAAHEEVASIPTRWAPPEPVFAQQNEPPTLALLRVEAPVAEKPADDVAAPDAPAEQVGDALPPVEPEKLAELKPEETAPPDAATPETTPAETTPATQSTPDLAEAPAPADQIKLAATVDAPLPASEALPATPEPASAPATPGPASAPVTPEPASVAVTAEQAPAPATAEISPAATKIATLGGPAVPIEDTASGKTTDAKPDSSEIKKRARARRLEERRRAARIAPRAATQQLLDPFGQLTITRGAR